MERFVACFEALARRLERRGFDATQITTCTAEEMALHLVIDAAEGATRTAAWPRTSRCRRVRTVTRTSTPFGSSTSATTRQASAREGAVRPEAGVGAEDLWRLGVGEHESVSDDVVVPVRFGGTPRRRHPDDELLVMQLLDELYGDPDVLAVLAGHDVPLHRRPAPSPSASRSRSPWGRPCWRISTLRRVRAPARQETRSRPRLAAPGDASACVTMSAIARRPPGRRMR
jgi:hypothetical protein